MRPPSAKAEEGASDFAWMLGTLRAAVRILPRRSDLFRHQQLLQAGRNFQKPAVIPNIAIVWTYLFGTSVNAKSGMRDIRIHALISATR